MNKNYILRGLKTAPFRSRIGCGYLSISPLFRGPRALARVISIFLILLAIFLSVGVTMTQAEEKKENPFGVLEFLPWNHSWNNYQYCTV